MDLAKGVWNKSRYDKTRPFLNPDSYNNEDTAQIESGQSFPSLRDQKDDKGDDIHYHGRPYPRHKEIMTMETLK